MACQEPRVREGGRAGARSCSTYWLRGVEYLTSRNLFIFVMCMLRAHFTGLALKVNLGKRCKS